MKRLVLCAVGVFIVLVILFAVGYILSMKNNSKQPFVIDIDQEVFNKIESAYETFENDRNSDGALRDVEILLKDLKDFTNEKALALLAKANYLLFEGKANEGLGIHANLFNEEKYSEVYRSRALFNATWFIFYNFPNHYYINLEEMNEAYFAQDKFGHLVSDTKLEFTNDKDAKKALYQINQLVIANTLQDENILLLANAVHQNLYTSVELPISLDLVYPEKDKESLRIKFNTFAIERNALRERLFQDSNESTPISNYKLSAISVFVQTYIPFSALYGYRFPGTEHLSYEFIRDEYENDLNLFYTYSARNNSFLNAVTNANNTFDFACAYVNLDKYIKDSNVYNLSTEAKQKLKGYIETYILTLSDEDLDVAWAWKEYTRFKNSDWCYKAIQYIGKEVEPKLQTLLIEKVGPFTDGISAWTVEDFK